MLLLLVLFSTLQSYYFYDLGIAPMPLFGGGIFSIYLFCYMAKSKKIPEVKKRNAFLVLTIFITVLFSSIMGISKSVISFNLKTSMGFFLGISLLSLILMRAFPKKTLLKVVRITLLLHCSMWLVQCFGYYFFNFYIDPLMPVTGEIQRYIHPSIAPFIRPAGFFNEPSTFSLYIVAFATLLLRHNLPRTDKLILITALVTVIGSFSSLGLILGAFLLIAICHFMGFSSVKTFLCALGIGVITALISEPFFKAIVQIFGRLTNPLKDGSGIIRLTYGMKEFVEHGTTMDYLLGWGLGNHDLINNAGMTIAYLVTFFGVLGATVLIGSISLLIRKAHLLIFLALLMLNAPIAQHPVFWVWLGLACLLGTQRKTPPTNAYLPTKHLPECSGTVAIAYSQR